MKKREMRKGQIILFFVTLCLTNVAIMADMVMIPAFGGIFEAFGNQIGLVNFIISGAAFMSIFTSFAGGKLIELFSKKTLLVASLVVFSIAGSFGAAVNNALYVAFMRGLMGLSWGLMLVVAMALITEVFIDENQRSKMMGYFNSAMSAIGAVTGLIAGFLATVSWQSVYKVFWIIVPVTLMAILFVPKTPSEGKQQAEVGSGGVKERIPLATFGPLALSYLVFTLCYSAVLYQISLYIFERGLGDESLAGIYSSLGTIGSAIASALLGYVYPKLRNTSGLISLLVLGVSLALLMATNSLFLAGVASFFAGATYGFILTFAFVHTTVIVPPTRVSTAIGFVSAAGALGIFISSYAATFLRGLMGVDADKITGIIPGILAILAVGVGLSVLEIIRERKQTEVKPNLTTA